MSSKTLTSKVDDLIKMVESERSPAGGEAKDDEKCEWPAQRIRDTFIGHFEKKHNHHFVKSSPVVPLDDPTLLFTNAGMNQFKPIFLGTISRDHPFYKYKSAANSQKCIRAGGKHNDLDDVGKDVYHHTFFEMLGNWSFGDYFKKEAIDMAWDLLTNTYKLDPNRLYATYFAGEKGVEPDNEARDIWLKYLPKERVLPFGMKDNFWEMGATGPCGPCTEIHYDRIGNRDAAHLVNMDYPDVLEIWNLVFIQFNREAAEEGKEGELKELPAQHVDTGMGFERLASILQNKMSNYDTDVWQPIFRAIEAGSGLPEAQRKYTGKVGEDDKDVVDTAYRVVADHIRTLTFAITDGAAPGPKDRSYVLRRVLRRAVYYGQYILQMKPGFLHKLVDTVVDSMGDFFTELKTNPDRVKELIKAEEILFNKTLNDGIRICKKEMSKLPKGSTIPPEVTFRMYSTCGFPFDLTERFADENGYKVCRAAFDKELQKEQELSRANQKEGQGGLVFEAEQTAHLGNKKIEQTDSEPQFTWQNISANLVAIYDGGKKSFADSCSEGQQNMVLILDRTSFYAESGGQVGDQGKICVGEGNVFKVEDTLSAGGYVLHIGTVLDGSLKVGAKVECQVDYENRKLVAPNHTMTHALNFALRQVIGENVDQRGSFVDQEKSRFDFSSSVVKPKQMEQVQQICAKMISDNLKVYSKECPLKKALEINSLRAVFGEKYPDPVRVVSIGMPIEKAMTNPKDPENLKYSIEFCGGTHLTSLGEAEELFLVAEGPVQSGVRRIEFITSTEARKARLHGEQVLELLHGAQKMTGAAQRDECNKIRGILQDSKDDSRRMPYLVRKQIENGLEEIRKKDAAAAKQAAKAKLAAATEHVEELAAAAVSSGAKFVVAEVDLDTNSKNMGQVVKKFHKACKLPVFFVSTEPGARSAVMIKAEAPKKGPKIDCKAWAESVAGLVQGRAGGKANSGTCNGTDHTKLAEVLKTATEFAEKAL